MDNVIIIRFAEIHLKGKNKKYFLNNLYKNICDNLSHIECDVNRMFNRLFISNYSDNDIDDILRILKFTAGISSLSVGCMIDTDIDMIRQYHSALNVSGTFKISCKRADKSFAINSAVFAAEIGGVDRKSVV